MGSLRTLINTIKTKLDTIAEDAKPFDVHDDVPTQNTSPSGADRIPHSDESASGDPNEYFRLDVLRDYFRRDAAATYALIQSLLDYADLQNQPTIPTLRNAAQTYALIQSLLNYNDLSNQPTIPTLRSASQTYALIQSLLNYNDLSNQPTIPTPFDIHDDVTTENTAPANQDRIPHSDESAAGDPNEYFRLDTLRDYFRRDAADTYALIEDLLPEGVTLRTAAQTYALIQSLLNYDDLSNQPTIPTPFDIHDDVTTQNTSPSGADRIPHSDESAAGDPNEYFRLDVLSDYFRRNAAETYALIESLLNYNDLSNQPTIPTLRNAAQTYALIQSLLDYDDLSNQPTIPTPFDIHDDVTTENTAPANQDRIPHSDESAGGDPNKYFRLDTLKDFFGGGGGGLERETTLPDADDAVSGAIYAEVDADDAILNDVLKVKSFQPNPFFAVTVANLGDGHRGYAGSGYGSLDSGFDVDAGGSSGYSALGAVSERFNSMINSTFQRVGTYTIPDSSGSQALGMAGDGGTLYYVIEIDNGTRVRGVNPETGVQTFESDLASGADNVFNSLAIYNGLAYVLDVSDDDFYTFNLETGVDARLNNTNHTGEIQALAATDDTIYALLRPNGDMLGTVNPTTGEVTDHGSISGRPNNFAALSLTSVNNVLYAIYINRTLPSVQKLFTLNPTTRTLTEIGDVSPASQEFAGLAQVGGDLYAWNDEDEGIYRSLGGNGNRWEVVFPTTTTEVSDSDATLTLYTSRGATPITLTRRTGIADAIVFASDYDGATAHTISVNDDLNMALYNSDDEQLYEGSVESFFRTIPLGVDIGV